MNGKAPKSLASSGNWGGMIALLLGAFATRPEWLIDLPSEHLNSGIINAAWIIGVSIVLSTFISAMIRRSGAVDAARVANGKPSDKIPTVP